MAFDFKSKINRIDNWPRPGIVCYDVAPLLRDKEGFHAVIEELARPYLAQNIDAVVGIEARGFLLASALAYSLGSGVVSIRKKNKLSPPTISQEYSYEYAAQVIEMQTVALTAGQRVVIIDDTLATGGTMAAAVKLIKKLGAEIAGASFIVEMKHMDGVSRLREVPVHSLVKYE